MIRLVQNHLGGPVAVPRIGKPGLHWSGWIPVVQGEGAAGHFQANGIAGGKDTGGGLELDLPAVNGIRSVAGLAKKIRGARDADAYKVGLSPGTEPHQLAGEVGVGSGSNAVEDESGGSKNVQRFGS